MRSVADDLGDELRRQVAALTPSERMALALRLGDDDVRAYAATHGVGEDEARRVLGRTRRIGRVRSDCIESLDP